MKIFIVSIAIICNVTMLCSLTFAQLSPWRRAIGTKGIAVAAMDVYRSDPDTVYAIGLRVIDGTGVNGVTLRSTNGGERWDSISAVGTDIGAIGIDPLNSKIIYASVPSFRLGSNNVIMSTDGGQSWRLLFIGRLAPAPVIESDPADPKIVYVGVGPAELMHTSDHGQTWDTLAPGVFGITSLAIAPSNDSILYLSYIDGVLKSTDKGNTWSRIAFSFQVVSVASVAVDPRDANIVYAGVFSFGGTPGGVYKSTDGGLTWIEKNNGLDSVNWHIYSLALNPKNPKELFVGDGFPKPFFRTTNAGEHWFEYSDGLPISSAGSITIDTLHKRIFVGSGSTGIYINDSITTAVDEPAETPKAFFLFQNYPNPFNPQTTIEFENPHAGRVAVEIYNILGQKSITLLDQHLVAGKYRITFDGSLYSSGTYFYCVRTQEGIFTKIMLLLR